MADTHEIREKIVIEVQEKLDKVTKRAEMLEKAIKALSSASEKHSSTLKKRVAKSYEYADAAAEYFWRTLREKVTKSYEYADAAAGQHWRILREKVAQSYDQADASAEQYRRTIKEKVAQSYKYADAAAQHYHTTLKKQRIEQEQLAKRLKIYSSGLLKAAKSEKLTGEQAYILKDKLRHLNSQINKLERAGADTRSIKRNLLKANYALSGFSKTTKKANIHTEKFANTLDALWKRFGQVAIGFSVFYRAINAFEAGVASAVNTVREGIKLTDDLVEMQAKMAMWGLIFGSNAKTFSEAFDKAGENVKAFRDQLPTALANIDELTQGIDELAQHGVIASKKTMGAIVNFIDFTSIVAKSTSSGTNQVRQEIQALFEGTDRAGNSLRLMFRNLGGDAAKLAKELKNAEDPAKTFMELSRYVVRYMAEVKAKMFEASSSRAFTLFTKTLINNVEKANEFAGALDNVKNAFASVFTEAFKAEYVYGSRMDVIARRGAGLELVAMAMRSGIKLGRVFGRILEDLGAAIYKLVTFIKNLTDNLDDNVKSLIEIGTLVGGFAITVEVAERAVRGLTKATTLLAGATGILQAELAPTYALLTLTIASYYLLRAGIDKIRRGWEGDKKAWEGSLNKQALDLLKSDVNSIVSSFEKLLTPKTKDNGLRKVLDGLIGSGKRAGKILKDLRSETTNFYSVLEQAIAKKHFDKAEKLIPFATVELGFRIDKLKEKIINYKNALKNNDNATQEDYLHLEWLNYKLKELEKTKSSLTTNLIDAENIDFLDKFLDEYKNKIKEIRSLFDPSEQEQRIYNLSIKMREQLQLAFDSLKNPDKEVIDKFNEVMHKLMAKKPSKSWSINYWKAIFAGFKEHIYTTKTLFDGLKQTVSNNLNSMEDAFIKFATTGKSSWKEMLNAMATDWLRFTYRLWASKMFQFIISRFMPTTINTTTSSYVNGYLSMHNGGVVGEDKPTFIKPVDPTIFANAPRFHNGLQSDEFPAILQRGETVIPKDSQPSGPNVTVNVINQTGQETKARQDGPRWDGKQWVIDVMLDAVNRRSDVRSAFGIA